VVSFSNFSTPKLFIHFYSLPYVPHSPSVPFFFILSAQYNLVRSTDHKAPQYAVFSTPLLPRPILENPQSVVFNVRSHATGKITIHAEYSTTPPSHWWLELKWTQAEIKLINPVRNKTNSLMLRQLWPLHWRKVSACDSMLGTASLSNNSNDVIKSLRFTMFPSYYKNKLVSNYV
jgi:hypothetical protein